MQTIKNIIVETGEECKIDLDVMHEALCKLPAELYVGLYHKMQTKILGYPYLYSCGSGISTTEQEQV